MFSKILLVLLLLPVLIMAQSNEHEIAMRKIGLEEAKKVPSPSLRLCEISGHIKGLKDGEKVVVKLFQTSELHYVKDEFINLDSTKVKNEKFYLGVMIPEGPRQLDIIIRNIPCKLVVSNDEKIVINTKGNQPIDSIRHSQIQNYMDITGSPTDLTYQHLSQARIMWEGTVGRLNGYLRKIKDSIGFDGALVDGIEVAKAKLHEEFYYDFLLNPDPSVYVKSAVLPVTRWFQSTSHRCSLLMDLYNSLNEEQKNSYYGKELREYARLSVGQPFPLFNFSSLDGKTIALKDVLAKNKITLVNFWGTNSRLSKYYHSELAEMYKQYHSKGLEIVAVSSDDYEALWKEYVSDAKFPWLNVIDKKGRIVDSLYHEYTMNEAGERNVTNVLLDSSGKIIAWDPTGIELQWYLWNALDVR